MKVADVIERSLRQIGVLDFRQSADAYMLQNGLEALNAMIRSWSTTKQGVYRITRETFTLSAGTRTYTIGSGATFDTVRPQSVVSAFVRDNDQDYQLNIIDRDWYNRWTDKTTQGLPCELYYDPSFPSGVIELSPVPSSNYTLTINTIKPFSEYSTVGDDIGLPPEYEAALPFNLAIELAAEFSAQVSPAVAKRAEETLKAANRLHLHPVGQTDTDVTNTNAGRFQIDRGY